jgi:hypothetical protein
LGFSKGLTTFIKGDVFDSISTPFPQDAEKVIRRNQPLNADRSLKAMMVSSLYIDFEFV